MEYNSVGCFPRCSSHGRYHDKRLLGRHLRGKDAHGLGSLRVEALTGNWEWKKRVAAYAQEIT